MSLGSSFNMAAAATTAVASMTLLQSAGFSMKPVANIAVGVGSMVASMSQGNPLTTAKTNLKNLAGGLSEANKVAGNMAGTIKSMQTDLMGAHLGTGNRSAAPVAQSATSGVEVMADALTGGASTLFAAMDAISSQNKTGKSSEKINAEISKHLCDNSPSLATKQVKMASVGMGQPAAPQVKIENDWNHIQENCGMEMGEIIERVMTLNADDLNECAKVFPEALNLLQCKADIEKAMGANEVVINRIEDLSCRAEIASSSICGMPGGHALCFDDVIVPDCNDIVLAENDNFVVAANHIEPDHLLKQSFGMSA